VNGRGLIWTAVLGNIAVMAASWTVYGWSVIGAHVAARNTARFSSLWFALGFAAPGLARWFRGLPGPRLVQAFVAAHVVHFAAVAMLLAGFETAHVSHNAVRSGLVVVIGSALVIAAGLSATPPYSPGYTTVHRVLMYVIFLLFFLALVNDPFKPMRGLVVFLTLAVILRVTAGFTFYTARTKTID
jgi:hypothetical protein